MHVSLETNEPPASQKILTSIGICTAAVAVAEEAAVAAVVVAVAATAGAVGAAAAVFLW